MKLLTVQYLSLFVIVPAIIASVESGAVRLRRRGEYTTMTKTSASVGPTSSIQSPGTAATPAPSDGYPDMDFPIDSLPDFPADATLPAFPPDGTLPADLPFSSIPALPPTQSPPCIPPIPKIPIPKIPMPNIPTPGNPTIGRPRPIPGNPRPGRNGTDNGILIGDGGKNQNSTLGGGRNPNVGGGRNSTLVGGRNPNLGGGKNSKNSGEYVPKKE
ncbi:hypothetical protein BKA69DRAFT_1086097 [Paraphysoderma sedebokerense]|nr:hypothetical protein BKA69DRAFT_1086097 [Paraphysoderma sedebokerense]